MGMCLDLSFHIVSILVIDTAILAKITHASKDTPDTKLWRAVFAANPSNVEVRNQYNKAVMDRFALTA